jgi:hypothetical protein
MKIVDTSHGILKLTTQELIQVEEYVSEYPYRVKLADLKRTLRDHKWGVPVHGRAANGDPNTVNVQVIVADRRIGCTVFNEFNWKKILKAVRSYRLTARRVK